MILQKEIIFTKATRLFIHRNDRIIDILSNNEITLVILDAEVIITCKLNIPNKRIIKQKDQIRKQVQV